MGVAAKEEVDIIKSRFDLLVSARLRRKTNIKKAIEIQDRIREWRDTRYYPHELSYSLYMLTLGEGMMALLWGNVKSFIHVEPY